MRTIAANPQRGIQPARASCTKTSLPPATTPSWPAAAAAAAVAAAAILAAPAGPARASTTIILEGPARVVDGDTLYIGKEKVRLYGIDAPEKTQNCSNDRGQPYQCGMVSLNALKERVGSRPVRCEVKTRDQYGRNVAACSISPDLPFQQPEDMGAFLVGNGYAVAYRAYGKEYVAAEEQAHREHRGIWRGGFTEPALWRKQQKAASLASSINASTGGAPAQQQQQQPPQQQQPVPATSSVGAGAGGRPSYAAVAAGAAAGSAAQQQQPLLVSAAGSCSGPLIKGNINSKGQKIYHTVSSAQYSRTEIEEGKGERYFCTEDEAAAAGWKAAKK